VLHIRVVCPARQTAAVTSLLLGRPEVMNMVVVPGAGRHPDGDFVQFDMQNSAANAVLADLRRLGLDRGSAIMVDSVDAVLTDQPRSRGWRQPHHGERSPVWELVEARVAADATYAPSFFLLLVIAALIGASGILTNSSILIVGAMVVGPEYSAIIAVALGLERHDRVRVRSGLAALIAGFLAAIAVTLLFALIIRGLGQVPELYRHGVRPVSDLINSPNLYSVVVAVLAAVVGVVSLILARTGPLLGVFISVTTIPAAADIAVSLAFGGWREARGSTLQLLLNVGVLIVVGALALRGQRFIWRRWLRSASAGSGHVPG
jgi:uncharacterized hydrophobic protein (TIGR00271 family)